jgi:hypothetical protein
MSDSEFSQNIDLNWFNLRNWIKRTYAKSVWVPLSLWSTNREGKFNNIGFQEIFEGVHSIAVPIERREQGERYSWQDSSDSRPWAEKDFYKPSDIYCTSQEEDVGIRLVLRQSVAGEVEPVWHLHQDFVIALDLLREGDNWVRPAEGHIAVARLRLASDGKTNGIEVRSEFLRDYLCARNLALRLATYRQKAAVLEHLGDINFPAGGVLSEIEGGRLEERAWPIDNSGSPFGSSVAVFKMSRNDVDVEADIPLMGPEDNENVESSSWSFIRDNGRMWHISSEFWRDEWIEPALKSPRVRNDHVPSHVTYIVEADGARMNADELNDEDIGRWLWFDPGIVNSVLSKRGARLTWYTKMTGGLSTPSDPSVHFGINESGLLTAYARDIARLSEWDRRLWAGFNASPEGGVCKELLSSQVHAEVSKTKAPEPFFEVALRQLSEEWNRRFGTSILRRHDNIADIIEKVHRFRASDLAGLLTLSKDVARLTADSIDEKTAQLVAPLRPKERRGSLKSFESALATICGPELAHRATGPLFAIYDLRLSDAHLPKSEFDAQFSLLGIEKNDKYIFAGYKLLDAVVTSLFRCIAILRDDFPSSK